MKRVIAFIILYSFLWILWTFVFLCPSTKAQWEGAEVQRLTYNDVPNIGQELKFYIDDNDNLYLFYLEGIRDTATGFVYHYKLLSMSKDKEGGWSQPEEIGNPAGMGWGDMEVGYDTKGGITHIVYARFLSLDYDTMYYTNSEMSDWELVKIDSLTNTYGARYDWLKVAFDTLCNVHLTWHVDYGSTGVQWYRVMYANNSTGEWVKQQVSPPIFLGGMGSGPSYLAVQKNGTVHIVYHGDVGSELSYYLRNDSLNSQNWHADTIPRPLRPLYHYGVGPMKVDVNDRVHLITCGCIEEYCIDPGLTRTFYYYKQTEDSIWQGPEQIPDTTFGSRVRIDQLLIDEDGIPYISYATSSNEAYFTDRKQGSWQVPYMLVGWHEETPDSFMVDDFCFVLDSQGKGHGAFSAFDFSQGMLDDDSVEIYYLSSSNSAVDTLQDYLISNFNLFQNYPNPFNSVTSIQYTVSSRQNHPIHTTLKIYNILGKEVRQLVNTRQCSGNYTITWDGKNNQGKEVSSGIYFYQLTVRQAHRPEQSRGRAGNFTETKKLVLIK